ncbi:hypothetical protein H5410_059173 [Solanum commersonii]|uniref:Uncharacterized protein n=1 Tax=Solanum commersonii TaxID=4109 RepID=A0A9J5W209_SOLCO|nr:hypothetical protein H5410_059173 [Solanum commersonii]
MCPWIFGDRISECFIAYFFSIHVRYDLINAASWSRGENKRIFKFKRAPKRENPNFTNFRVIVHEILVIRDSGFFFAKNILTDVVYDLINGVNWSRGANERIFMFKRSPKQENSNFINFRVL